KFSLLNMAHGIAAHRSAIASLSSGSRVIEQCPIDLSRKAGYRGVERGAGPSMCSSCPMERCWSLTTKPEPFIGSATKNETGLVIQKTASGKNQVAVLISNQTSAFG